MSKKGHQLDLTSAAGSQSARKNGADRKNGAVGQDRAGGPFLGIHFLCCDVYARVYANRQQTAYVGHCPRCAKQIQLQIGSGGTEARFFKVF